jgi:hypothetical protein
MLRLEPGRAHKFEPQHLGGARDERVNGHFSGLKRACKISHLKIDVNSI